MAKRATKTRIKGADAADKEQIAAARAVNKAEANTRTTSNSPEAAPTPREARDAAQKLFDKADEEGKAEIIAQTTLSRAVFG